jgi:Ser/Thr protein kinase RdoA (MazF antagonist)
VVLDPIVEDEIDGCSCAVFRFCIPLSERGWLKHLQQVLLLPRVLCFMRRSARTTRALPAGPEVQREFVEPLEQLAANTDVGKRVRVAASNAQSRLAAGDWQPRHILMHGDLWQGNILIDADDNRLGQLWPRRFVLIDWAGSRVNGYPIVDLLALYNSFNFPAKGLRLELEAYCGLLECALQDARSYLVAGLAHRATRLEYFPASRFAQVADQRLVQLEEALGPAFRASGPS